MVVSKHTKNSTPGTFVFEKRTNVLNRTEQMEVGIYLLCLFIFMPVSSAFPLYEPFLPLFTLTLGTYEKYVNSILDFGETNPHTRLGRGRCAEIGSRGAEAPGAWCCLWPWARIRVILLHLVLVL